MIDISPVEVLIILVIALLIFGPKRLPEMARSLGKGIRDFKSSMSGVVGDEPPPAPREKVGDPTAVPASITAQMAADAAAEAPVATATATATVAAETDDVLDGVVVPGSQRPEATPSQ